MIEQGGLVTNRPTGTKLLSCNNARPSERPRVDVPNRIRLSLDKQGGHTGLNTGFWQSGLGHFRLMLLPLIDGTKIHSAYGNDQIDAMKKC